MHRFRPRFPSVLVYSFATMNKKIVLGCLGAVVVVVIAGSIAGYFYVYRPARQYIQSFADVGKIGEMDSEVQNKAAFTTPEDSLLTEDEVTRFVEVQRAITSQLGAHLENLKQKYNSVSGEGSQNPGIAEFITFWKDFSGTILKAKQIQVEALNSANFSLDEYRWVRSSFYQALGAKFVSLNLDRALTAIKEQNPDLLKGDQAGAEQLAPEQNQKLVEPYTQEAQNWIAYAWLGL